MNFGGPSPSVPLTRAAIIALPLRVRRPCSVPVRPMIGENAVSGCDGLASQNESFEFST